MNVENALGLPKPFVDAATSDYTYTPGRYSVTSILGGLTRAILARRHQDEIAVDAADSVWAVFGSAVHKILEESQEGDTEFKETKLTVPVGNYTLSGIFDLYDMATGTCVDYKTGTTWKVIYDEWDDYRNQLLAYAWMLEQSGLPCRHGQIVLMLKDWSRTKAKTTADYPKHPVYVKRFEFSDRDLGYIGGAIKAAFWEIQRLEQMPDGELPPCDKESRWNKPDKWAVMKKGRKRALKLYESEEDAAIHALEVGGYVEHRPGVDGRCVDYCDVCRWCPYYQKRYGGGSDGASES